MIGQDQLLGRRHGGVEQRGDQAVLLLMADTAGIIDGVANEPDHQVFPPPPALALAGPQSHQLRAVAQGCDDLRLDMRGDPVEDLGSPCQGGSQEIVAVQSHVREHQHPPTHRPQQAEGSCFFVMVVGPHPGIADGMGPALPQRHQLGLRPGTGAPRGRTTTKHLHVGRRIGQVDHGAVDGHEPQAEEEGSWGVRGSQRLTHAMEEADQRLGTEAIAGLGDATLGDPEIARFGPEPAKPLHQAPEDGG